MSGPPPPLRFLLLALGGWASARTLFLVPGWWEAPVAVAEQRMAPASVAAETIVRSEMLPSSPTKVALTDIRSSRGKSRGVGRVLVPASPSLTRALQVAHLAAAAAVRPATSLGTNEAWRPAPMPVAPAALPQPIASSRRWSVSAWAFMRRGDSPVLAPGGLLGGGQAGVRIGYRINADSARPLAVTARLYLPTRQRRAAEAAVGVDWRPSRRLPLHFVAERRQAVRPEGRSAFGLLAYGGFSEVRAGPFRLDAYGQAGMVGARRRDLFADGTVRLALPLGRRLRVGAGGWAAAQPEVSRIDVGPHGSVRLPVASGSVTLAADWRLRVAGNARPGSGPTLTLSTDF